MQFAYNEAGTQKAALVKLRLCPKHALQLNYQKNQESLKLCCCILCHVTWVVLHLDYCIFTTALFETPLLACIHFQQAVVLRDVQAQEKRRQKEERRAAKRRKHDEDASLKRKRRKSGSPSQPGSPSPDETPSDADARRQGSAADAAQPLPAASDADVDAVFAGLFE